MLYEHVGIDKHGLQLWKCLHGTDKVEGGPHGDIYRKFGAHPFCSTTSQMLLMVLSLMLTGSMVIYINTLRSVLVFVLFQVYLISVVFVF